MVRGMSTDTTAADTRVAADAPSPPPLNPSVWRVAIVVVIGSIMSILDTTIVNVAIRALSRSFHAPLETTQWVATGYMLALATVIPLTGWAADRFGTKRLYMMSILLFLAGSALSGMAWSIESLIVFRVLQGLGGGMLMPVGMIILNQAAGPEGSGRIMSIIGVPMLLGPICGPILGGWLVDDFSWRWIFLVNLPVGALAIFAALRNLPGDTSRPHHRLDWPGLLLLSPGLAVFVFGLAETAARGNVGNIGSDACLIIGSLMISGFMVHSWRSADALIDIRLFTQRAPGSGALTSFLFGVAFFGMALLMPLYFQIVRNASAFEAGLLLIPQGLGAMIAMPIAGIMTDRIGPRRVVLIGVGIVSAGIVILSMLGVDTPFTLIELALLLNGIGMGGVMMPSMSAVMGSVTVQQLARATSGLNVIQRIGGSMGTALLTVVLAHELAIATGHGPQTLRQGIPAGAEAAVAAAFARTFRVALAVMAATFIVALRLPPGRLKRASALSGTSPTAQELMTEAL